MDQRTYSLHITQAAENDIGAAADYIAHVLMNPQAADGLLDAVENSISALVENLQRHSIVSDPVLKAWEIRCLQIKNYLAFYVVDDAEAQVRVVRFLYMKRDWIQILHEGLT